MKADKKTPETDHSSLNPEEALQKAAETISKLPDVGRAPKHEAEAALDAMIEALKKLRDTLVTEEKGSGKE